MLTQNSIYRFQVDYTCINCASMTSNIMSALPYVKNFTVNFQEKSLTVEVAPGISPDAIIEEIRKKGKTAVQISPGQSEILLQAVLPVFQQELDFEVDVNEAFRDQFPTLFFFPWCDRTFVDHASKRLRVLVKHNHPKEIKPSEIFERLRNHTEQGVVKIRSIPINNRFFLFSLKGIKTEADAESIKKKLEGLGALVKRVHVNFSTRAVCILANIEDDKISAFNQRINLLVRNTFEHRNIELKPTTPPEGIHRSVVTAPKTYFRRAILNMLFVLPLIFLGGAIPLPLTIFGQFIGLAIGGVTLSMMYKTGKEFYQEAWNAFVHNRSFNMYTLIALGTGSAWLYSMILVLFPGFFPIVALQYQFLAVNMILGIINFGRGIRVRAEELTNKMVQDLSQVYAQNQPQLAKRVNSNVTDIRDAQLIYEEIDYRNIKEGDVLLVDKLERFPCEGTIISDSETNVEQSAITGEPGPVFKKRLDSVYSGSQNNKAAVLIKATCDGSKGNLTRVLQEVAKSSTQPPTISRLVDKIANIFVPSIVIVAGLSALGWLIWGPLPQIAWMIQSAMSVLLCACPCAMGLSVIPMSIGVNECLSRRILVRDATALEALAEVDAVVWDKTGTVTTPGVEDIYVIRNSNFPRSRILQFAASVEKAFLSQKQEHPIAQCFINQNSSNQFLPCSSFENDGQGVSGIVEDEKGDEFNVSVGSLSYLEARNISIPPACLNKEENFESSGKTAIYIAINGKCVSVVGLQHTLRTDAKASIDELRELNIDVFMLTGDKKEPALSVARQLGIPENRVMFEQDKEGKRQQIINLQKQYARKVAFIGDGFNDSLALNEAYVSFGVGAWTSAAAQSKIALQKLNVATAIIIARETMKNIRQNLYWTGFYNLLSITAATGLLYPLFGFVLNPVFASFCMAFSSVCVLINSTRLTFEVEEKLAMHERRLSRPSTWLEKVKNFFSIRSLFRTLEKLINLTQENPRSPASIIPQPTAAQGQGSPRKQQTTLLPSVGVLPSQLSPSSNVPEELTSRRNALKGRRLQFD